MEIRTTGHAGAQYPIVINNDVGNAFYVRDTGDAQVGGTLTVAGIYKVRRVTPGVTCTGAPTASFASAGGIVTHC